MMVTEVTAGTPNFYDDIVTAGLTSGLQVVLDAGSSTSYTSGEKWLDLSGNGYDFMFGGGLTDTSSEAFSYVAPDDPTFTGTAGNLSSSEYMSFDGDDFFQYDSANETWMDNIHQDGALYCLAAWVYVTDATDFQILGDRNGGNTGFKWAGDGLDLIELQINNGASSVLNGKTDAALAQNQWNFIAVVVDEAATTGFFYRNGAYDQVSSADTFTSTYSSPSDGAANETLCVCADGASGSKAKAGTRISGVFIWEGGTAITKANLDTLWNAQKDRFGL